MARYTPHGITIRHLSGGVYAVKDAEDLASRIDKEREAGRLPERPQSGIDLFGIRERGRRVAISDYIKGLVRSGERKWEPSEMRSLTEQDPLSGDRYREVRDALRGVASEYAKLITPQRDRIA